MHNKSNRRVYPLFYRTTLTQIPGISKREMVIYFSRRAILLMEEILHQLIGNLSFYLQYHLHGFVHPRWFAGFLPSTVPHNMWGLMCILQFSDRYPRRTLGMKSNATKLIVATCAAKGVGPRKPMTKAQISQNHLGLEICSLYFFRSSIIGKPTYGIFSKILAQIHYWEVLGFWFSLSKLGRWAAQNPRNPNRTHAARYSM